MFFWKKGTPEQRAAQAKAAHEASLRFAIAPEVLFNGSLGYRVYEKEFVFGRCLEMPILGATYTTKEAAQAVCDHMNGEAK
jgi:hypothetical protein